MQKSYESGKATPGVLYMEELSDLTGISIKDLVNKELKKTDIKKLPPKVKVDGKGRIVEKVENVGKVESVGKGGNIGKGEKNAANSYIELLTAENLKFRGLLI